MPTSVVTPPSAFVNEEEAKRFMRIDHADENGVIEPMAKAACARLDGPGGVLGRAIGTQRLAWTGKPSGWREPIRLMPPVTEIVSVAYLDSAAVSQTIDAANYRRADDRLIFLNGYVPPAGDFPDALTITFDAGYSTIPPELKQAALELTAHLYANREAGADIPAGVWSLVFPFRVITI